MTARLDDQLAVVTGASSGIGAATCRHLAAEGAAVVLAARSEDRLAELAADLETTHGVETLVVPTDIREEAAVDRLIDRTIETFGRIDILVNNAGLSRGSDVAEAIVFAATRDGSSLSEIDINRRDKFADSF